MALRCVQQTMPVGQGPAPFLTLMSAPRREPSPEEEAEESSWSQPAVSFLPSKWKKPQGLPRRLVSCCGERLSLRRGLRWPVGPGSAQHDCRCSRRCPCRRSRPLSVSKRLCPKRMENGGHLAGPSSERGRPAPPPQARPRCPDRTDCFASRPGFSVCRARQTPPLAAALGGPSRGRAGQAR